MTTSKKWKMTSKNKEEIMEDNLKKEEEKRKRT
jgi:hypothetical protein